MKGFEKLEINIKKRKKKKKKKRKNERKKIQQTSLDIFSNQTFLVSIYCLFSFIQMKTIILKDLNPNYVTYLKELLIIIL